ncbi:cytochrome P450 86B1-like [Quercus lobata]|uniref:cytochrome P450 86B1-like n=1 Tax=Quercus lobata TaxID=97700 RepID=UPI001244317B|nr:cytochrome P450 86B1-like [Quercus lobata]
MLNEFYSRLFNSSQAHDLDRILDEVDEVVTDEMRVDLVLPYTSEEVDAALKEMAPLKAPGPDETESVFTADHLITDNILIAFETLHHMKTNCTRKKGFMALKMDTNKAFDSTRDIAVMRNPVFSSIQWLYTHFCWEVSISLLVLTILSCILQRLTNKGPMLWPVMGILPSVFLHINNIYDWTTRSLIKAGGTFHFRGMWMEGFYGIMTAVPSNIEYMLKTKFKNFPKGKHYKERFYDLLGNGIFNADDQLWKEQRRIAISEMHSSRFVEYSVQTMQDLVHQRLLKLLEKLVESRDSFDLQEVLLRFTFDNICTAALGIDPGCLALDLPEIPFAKAFEEATEFTLLRFLVPSFVWKVMRLLEVGYEKRLKKAIKIVNDFSEKIVTDRKNELVKFGSLNDHSDLLSRLIEDSDQGMKNHFSDKFLSDFCINFILAG